MSKFFRVFSKFIIVVCILFSYRVYAGIHYNVSVKEPSQNIGNVYEVNKPMAYIKGLSQCNELPKEIALNTDCLKTRAADYRLDNIMARCANCLDSKRMKNPLSVEVRKGVRLKVVGEYTSKINYLMYRLFGSNGIDYSILEDQDGNLLEVMTVKLDILFFDPSNELKRFMTFEREDGHGIAKLFCFDGDVDKFKNVLKMLDDFKLNNRIQAQEMSCKRIRGFNNGVMLMTDDFNALTTFEHFRVSWGINGRWY